MATRKLLREAGTITPPAAGTATYPVRIISEGTGSTGIYTRELLERSADVFSGVPSFLNHPLDPNKPHERDVNTIAGRFGEARFEVVEGEGGLYSEFTPRAEFAPLFEQFADILGISIFCAASGEQDESGKILVESFDGADPYRSADVVIAAGRGGRFERAQEALRVIESSLGIPATKPGVEASAQEINQEVGSMDELTKAVEALTALLSAHISESKAAADKAAVAEADADVIEKAKVDAVTGAVEAYDEKIAAISAVEDLLPSQVEALRADAKEGKDIAPALEAAKKVVAEFKAVAESAPVTSYGRSVESAGAKDDDFTVAGYGA